MPDGATPCMQLAAGRDTCAEPSGVKPKPDPVHNLMVRGSKKNGDTGPLSS